MLQNVLSNAGALACSGRAVLANPGRLVRSPSRDQFPGLTETVRSTGRQATLKLRGAPAVKRNRPVFGRPSQESRELANTSGQPIDSSRK